MERLEPRIEILSPKKLVGMKTQMSLVNNQTRDLWMAFSPRKKEIQLVDQDLYSVEIYPDENYFRAFNPAREFEKWAAVEVSDFEVVPEGMYSLTIPQGEYAVFHYQGRPSEVPQFFQTIFGVWFPNSPYAIDTRPHFAVMGEKYKGEDPASEEDFWIPIYRV